MYLRYAIYNLPYYTYLLGTDFYIYHTVPYVIQITVLRNKKD
jgi:hypothetical protein